MRLIVVIVNLHLFCRSYKQREELNPPKPRKLLLACYVRYANNSSLSLFFDSRILAYHDTLRFGSHIFQLSASPRTQKLYPFDFLLTVGYTARDNALRVDYRVENHGGRPMPFCIGCHTAYNWPLMPGDAPEDYILRFEQPEALESFNPFGWRQPFVSGQERPLAHELFRNFTRSLTGIRSSWVEF